MSRIVVTGAGAICASGTNLSEIFNALKSNTCGIQEIKRFNTSCFPVKSAAELLLNKELIKNLKLNPHRIDPFAVMAIISVGEALKDAGISIGKIASSRIGIFWASGNGGIQSADEGQQQLHHASNPLHVGPFFQAKVLNDHASSQLAAYYGIKGPVITTVSACASGNAAIQTAGAFLNSNIIDVAITGGSEAAVTPSVLAGFSAMKALSRSGNILPFGEYRDGFLPGEGAACLVLEKDSFANKRHAKVHAHVRSAALMNEAAHMTNPDQESHVAAAVLKQALDKADLEPEQIDAIYAHGTGTPAGDASEYNAYKIIWKNNLKYIPVVATKHNTGHLLGASASLEAALAVQMLREQTILPTHAEAGSDRNFQDPPLFMPQAAIYQAVKHVLNYASGFGGQQSAVIFSLPVSEKV